MDLHSEHTILVTCGHGLADFVQDEIAALGYQTGDIHDGGVELQGSLTDAMRLNLELRTGLNVLMRIHDGACRDPEELYRQLFRLPWEMLIDPSEYISVVSKVDTPSIKNTMYASLKVKDAIVDRISQQTGRRPDSGSSRDHVVVHLYWKDERFWLYVNTSGRKISDRSYRRLVYKAPMRESLAAAVMMATGYDGSTPLVNPMCGSGTLAIEAALLALNRAPGLLRNKFGFMHLKGYEEPLWGKLRLAAKKKQHKDKTLAPVIASDIDPEAVEVARKNALTAGVDHLITFHVCDFAETPLPDEKGIIILNPEYGQRLGEIRQLETTYKRIGDYFKQQCTGYTGYIFTGNLDLAKKIGLRTSKRHPFSNGGIDCRLLKYELYEGTRKNIPT